MITFRYFNSLIIMKNVNYFNSLIQITHRKEKVESYCVLSDHRQFSWECSPSQDSQFGFSILIKWADFPTQQNYKAQNPRLWLIL